MNIDAQIALEQSKIGYHETGVNVNDFTPWQTDGAWNGVPWCDSFCQWGAVEGGGYMWPDFCQWGSRGDSYCPFTVNHAQQLGIWREPTVTPARGWQVLFSFGRNGIADHIGTVYDVRANGDLVTIEGNTSDRVAYRLRDLTYVMGFVELDDTVVPPPVPPADPSGTVADPTDPGYYWSLRKPMLHGGDITRAQVVLRDACGQTIDADGWYGKQTRGAVVNFQRFFQLQIDGVVGPATWGSMAFVAASKGLVL